MKKYGFIVLISLFIAGGVYGISKATSDNEKIDNTSGIEMPDNDPTKAENKTCCNDKTKCNHDKKCCQEKNKEGDKACCDTAKKGCDHAKADSKTCHSTKTSETKAVKRSCCSQGSNKNE
jgi:hypothetical protein